MASKKISELPASGALTGAELVEAVQGGINVQTTAQDIADLGGGGGGAVDSVNGQTGVVVLDAADVSADPAGTAAALLTGTISDGDTTHAPTGNAVFDLFNQKVDLGYTIRPIAGNHTLDATDVANYVAGSRYLIEMNSITGNTLTIPNNATLATTTGFNIEVYQNEVGTTTFVAGGGVTIKASAGVLTMAGQYTTARLIKTDADEWALLNGSPTVLSGTYTPSLVNTTNVNASTAYVTGYHRIGNSVTVYGKVDIDATAAASTATLLGMTLPVSSDIAAEQDLGGTASSNASGATSPIRIIGDATNNRASFVFLALTTNNDSYNFQFSYQIK